MTREKMWEEFETGIIDVIERWKKRLEQEPFNVDTYCKEHFVVIVDKDVWETAEKALKQEPKWIPVSERLPEEIGTYMTTVDYGKHGIAVGQRYYHGKCLGWEDDCVIAWMPLPKPYKAESEVSE